MHHQHVISFENVTKRFGSVTAVDRNSLGVRPGEFLSILGASGCGKTTVLRLIAGFEQPSEGKVLINGEDFTGVPAYKRPINMVFQHYALFPHLSVAENVSFGLRQQRPRLEKSEVQSRVADALAMVRLSGYENRRSHELSGGQQQRVALARALINRPSVLLLDEPLAALDRKLRRDMQMELQNLQRSLGITFLLVTHDQEEALSMSDRVCLMQEGRIVQIGTPDELYEHPANQYVAGFVGKSNFMENRSENEVLSVRPEMIEMARTEVELSSLVANMSSGKILNRIFLGEHTEYRVDTEHYDELTVLVPRRAERASGTYKIGDNVAVGWRADAIRVVPK